MNVNHPGQQIESNLQNARQIILEVVNEQSKLGSQFQVGSVLHAVAQRLDVTGNTNAEQHLLTIIHDLFRAGLLAPGYNLSNASLPFMHMTDAGRAALENVSRDPSNPDGYIAHLSNLLTDDIALSYIREAVNTYNGTCYKAAAVMAGCATERLVLLVRDELVDGLNRQGTSIPSALEKWQYKTVRDAVGNELNTKKSQMPRRLKEAYESFWTPFTEQPRLYRNDAGHPKSIDPVTHETVHSNLLMFPELSKLVNELVKWISIQYQ